MRHLKRFESKEANIDIEEVKDILTEINDEYLELKIKYLGENYKEVEVFEITGFDGLFSKFDSQITLKFYQFYNKLTNLVLKSCERIRISQNVEIKILGLYNIHTLTHGSDKIIIGLYPKST